MSTQAPHRTLDTLLAAHYRRARGEARRAPTPEAEIERLRAERELLVTALWVVATGREDRVAGMPANLGPSRLMDVAVDALERIGEI